MMFKPTLALQKTIRRLPLSTKQAGKEYYKGNRVGDLGTIDKWGRFRPDFSKIRTFVYPEDGNARFDLTPFVSPGISIHIGDGKEWKVAEKRLTGEEYLALWKKSGGDDSVDVPADLLQPSEYATATGAGETTPEIWEEPAQKKS